MNFVVSYTLSINVMDNLEVNYTKLLNSYVPNKRCYQVNDKFFEDGNVICEIQCKQTTVDEDTEEFLHKSVSEFCCHISGCTKVFTSLLDFETHYNSLHRHVCQQCKKLFPTAHLLETHVLETHDSFFKVMAERKHMFRCLVEGCSDEFRDQKQRKDHLVKIHSYPSDFRFNKPDKMIETRKTLSQLDMEIDEQLEVETAKLPVKYRPKIPKSICFGQGSSRCFVNSSQKKIGKRKKKNWHEGTSQEETKVDIEDVVFDDLLDTLPK